MRTGRRSMEVGAWRIACAALLGALLQVAASVRLLACHSTNTVPSGLSSVEYVFIATKKADCTFVFEGPEGSKLDMEVRSISFPKRFADTENCKKSKLTIYNYSDSKVILGKLVCNENEKASLLTKSNMGIVTSSLTDGSFSIKIRPKTNSDRTLSEMTPPKLTAEDFFFKENSDDHMEGFRPIAGGFRPSLLLQQTDIQDVDSNYHPTHLGFYPGRPTQVVDITYNGTGHNFTIITHPGYPLPGGGSPSQNPETTTALEDNTTTSSAGLSTTPQSTVQISTVVAQASVAPSIELSEEEKRHNFIQKGKILN